MRTIRLAVSAVTTLALVAAAHSTNANATDQPAEGGGGIGWCGWRNYEEGGSGHNFLWADNKACMTGEHGGTIPGHCEGGGNTHSYVPNAC